MTKLENTRPLLHKEQYLPIQVSLNVKFYSIGNFGLQSIATLGNTIKYQERSLLLDVMQDAGHMIEGKWLVDVMIMNYLPSILETVRLRSGTNIIG